MGFNFTSILKSLVLEASKIEVMTNQFLKPKEKGGKKIKPLLTPEEFYTLIQGDPDTKMNNVDPFNSSEKEIEQIKPGGYSNWIIKHYLNPELPENIKELEPETSEYKEAFKEARRLYIEDLYKITNDLKKFIRFKNKIEGERDLNKLTPSELQDKVKDFSLEKIKASKEEKEVAKDTFEYPGSEIIHRGPKWTVVKIEDSGPLGKNAAQFFGGYHLEPKLGETTWCTSSTMHSHFDYYIKHGPLFVVLPNGWDGDRGQKTGLPATRYQFHFSSPGGPSPQYMNPADRMINIVDFLNGEGQELKYLFKNYFASALVSSGKELDINDITSSKVGQFVALYGLDELFDSLPDNLEKIQIANSGQPVLISVPNSISRFKSLEHIGFVNCINTLPESICELKNLNYINIQNNSQLETIPDCIGYIPSLIVVSLKNCPNVKIPASFEEKGINRGGNIWDFEID